MSVYSELHKDIKNCNTHGQLLKVVKHIMDNKKELQLDVYEVDRLEDAGLRRYEQIDREMVQLSKSSRKR
jgi:hypothetical protein